MPTTENTLTKRNIYLFLLQQWLRERDSVLRNTYIASPVSVLVFVSQTKTQIQADKPPQTCRMSAVSEVVWKSKVADWQSCADRFEYDPQSLMPYLTYVWFSWSLNFT